MALLLLLAAAGGSRAATTVTTEPSPIILGRTPVVTITVSLDPALAAAPGRLKASANVGELGFPVDLGGGKARMTYAPPPTKYPQMALLAVWKEKDGAATAPVEFLRLPLSGVTKIEASSRPGAELRARVGDETYGPAIAGKNGQAVVAVVIAPGTKDMVLLAKTGGVVTERTIAVESPPFNRLAAAVTPSELSGSSRAVARLDVLYDVPGPVNPQAIHARASAGTLTFEGAEGGRLRYRWEPGGAVPPEVTFTVSAENDPPSQVSATVRQQAVEQAPSGLSVGARAGLTHSLGSLLGPRYALDAWAYASPGGFPLGLGLTAGYGHFQQEVQGPPAAQVTRSEVTLLPVSVRLGAVPVRLGGVSLTAGVAFVANFAHYQTFDATTGKPGDDLWRLGPTAQLFAGGAWRLGPGQAFGEVVLSWAALNDASAFRLQAGGLGVEVGYRFDLWRGK
ncbi:MAG TPA: hypothetical protein VND93_28975 [Myxococcales bacterium]|nr:hypothetical protein [Myxococcales bacterium]